MGNQRTRGRKYDRNRENQRGEHSRALENIADKRRRRARERYAERKASLRASNPTSSVPRQPRSERSIRRMVKRSVDFIRGLSARNEELESRIVAGVVSHHELKGARTLASVYSDKKVRCAKMLLDNMSEGLSTVKCTHSQDDVIAKKCALRMLYSQNIVQSRLARVSGRILKLAPPNFRIHALGRAEVLDYKNLQVGKWAGMKPGRKQRSDHLLPELKDLVVKWWTERTRVSPVAKNVLKRESHAVHTLDIPQTQFYMEFLEAHPTMVVNGLTLDVSIGQTMFCKFKPRWVKKEKDRNVCCCKYHVELAYLIQTLNDLRMEHGGIAYCTGIGCECRDATCVPCNGKLSCRTDPSDECLDPHPQALKPRSEDVPCNAAVNTFGGSRDLLKQFLCPPIHIPTEGDETEFWFRQACVNMECSCCGMGRFKASLCPVYEATSSSSQRSVQWKRYEYVGQGIKDYRGHERKRLELVHVETDVPTFIEYFTNKAKQFIKHQLLSG